MSEPAPRAPELALRVASALVLAAIALGLLYVGGNAFAILCAVGAALVAWEYRGIVATRLSRELALTMLAFVGLVIALWFGAGPDHAAIALAGGFLVLFVWEALTGNAWWAAGGLAYCGLPFLALGILRGAEPAGGQIVAMVFAINWGADIFAYFAGRAIGGPKLAPRISPKKTWAGFFGGIVGSLLLGGVVALFLGIEFGPAAVLLASALSVTSQFGDLLESMLKRRFGIKDSSGLIPGHGGVMDRIDGLVFVAVATWLCGVAVGGEALVAGSPARALLAAFAGS